MNDQIASPLRTGSWNLDAFHALMEAGAIGDTHNGMGPGSVIIQASGPPFANERLIRRFRMGRTWLNLRDRIDIQTDWDRRQLERVARKKAAATPRAGRWM